MMAEPWQDEGGEYLYHYTEAGYARSIADDEYFMVGDGAHYGYGLYATDLVPAEASPSEIRRVCFSGDAPKNAFDGVLVLLADDPQTPFESVDDQIYLLEGEEQSPGELIPMFSILVGVGTRLVGADWEIESWP